MQVTKLLIIDAKRANSDSRKSAAEFSALRRKYEERNLEEK